MRELQSKVKVFSSTVLLARTMGQIVRQHGSFLSCLTSPLFIRQICDCSVKTELIYKSNCAKNSFNRFPVGTIVDRQYSTAFAFEQTSGQWTRDTEDWVSAFCKNYRHLFRNRVPVSLWFVFVSRIPCILRSRFEE